MTRTVTTERAAVLLNVPAQVIRKWKQRRKVTPAGMLRGPGRGGMVPLYRLEDLRPLADRYHATRRDGGDAT